MGETQETSVSAETKNQAKNDGCGVDWSWLAGRKIAHATNDLQSMTIEFEDGLTFKIQTMLYKGEAFLSFTPYKDPQK